MPIVRLENDDGETNEVEVPADAIETRDDEDVVVKKQEDLNKSFSSRANRAKRTTLESVGVNPDKFRGEDGYSVDEDEVFRTLAEKRGIELRDDGKPKGSVKDEELQELRQKASKAESLQEKVQQYEDQIHQTRETELENQLLQNAEGFQSEQAKKTFLREAKARMTYDDDYGWVEAGEDGIAYDAGQPRGPEAVIDDLRDTHNFLFQDTEVKNGPNVQPGGNTGGKRTWTEQEWQEASKRTHEMDADTFQDWDTAREEGRVK